MAGTITALLAIADGADRLHFEQAFAAHPVLDIVAVADSLTADWESFLKQKSDIVVVAYGDDSESIGHIVARASRQRPDRPIVIAAYGSQNGLLRHAFESGADDVVLLPQSPEAL